MTKTSVRLTAALAVVAAFLVLLPASASAEARLKSVGTPHLSNGKVVASADVHTDCDATFECWTFVKIERLSDPIPGVPGWLRKWKYVTGRWAENGVNKLSAPPIPGCASYRMVVDTYNDAPGNSALSASLGPVELSLGGDVKRYHQVERSKRNFRHCNFA